MHKTLISLLLATATAMAQSYTVSPSVVGGSEGNTNNTYPWNFSSGRYQQIHGDMRGSLRTITALSMRRDGAVGASTSATARTIDAEYFMADSDFDLASSTFASNYAGPVINVVTRKNINLPDWTAAAPKPAPWTFTLPLDLPFVHTGLKDLVWEVVVHSNTATGTWPADANQSTLSTSGISVSTGSTTGCFSTGRTSRMNLSASQTTDFITQSISLTYFGNSAPANAASAFVVGLVNPSLAVPGLCSPLYVDQAFLTINTTAGATGFFSSPEIKVPFDPLLVGFRIHAQAVAVDAGQAAGIPVSLSNGLQTTFAAMPLTPSTGERVARIWLSGSSGTTGTLWMYFGLVTQFTH
jgi:hypothetical protein